MDSRIYNKVVYKSDVKGRVTPSDNLRYYDKPLSPDIIKKLPYTGTFEFDQYYDLVIAENNYVLPNQTLGETYVKEAKNSLKRRNEKLESLGNIWFESRKELVYGNDPGRSECVDRGEIHDLHKEYRNTAVRRYFYRHGIKKKSVLLRLETGNPVIWNNERNEWVDISVVDEKLGKKFKKLVRYGGGTGKYDNIGPNRDHNTDWNSEALCYLPRNLQSDVEQMPPKPDVAKKYIIRYDGRCKPRVRIKPESNADTKEIFETSHAPLDRKRGYIQEMTDEEKQYLNWLTEQGFREFRVHKEDDE